MTAVQGNNQSLSKFVTREKYSSSLEFTDTSKNEFPERRQHLRYNCNILDIQHQKLTNISASGVRLESPFVYGILDQIEIDFPLNGAKEQFKAKARVVRQSEGLGFLKYKYGLMFSEFSKDAQEILNKQLNSFEKENLETITTKQIYYRLPRVDISSETNFIFEGSGNDGFLFTSSIVNYSEFGLQLCIKNPLEEVRVGTFLCGKIFLEGYLLFEGNVQVTNISKNGVHIKYGVELLNGYLKETRISAIKKLKELKEQFEPFLAMLDSSIKLPLKFEFLIYELKTFLQAVKEFSDLNESIIHSFESVFDREWLRQELLDYYSQPLKKKLHAIARRISYSIKDFSHEDHKRHIKFFRDQLLHLTNASALYRRAYEKPLGYAGDYLMLNILCKQTYAGKTFWESLANCILTSIPPGQVVRDRTEYVRKKIEVISNCRSGMIARVLNFACGSCEEVTQFIENGGTSLVQYYLVDQEPRALEFSLRQCKHANLKREDKIKTCFIQNTVKQFLKEPNIVAQYPKMNFIYSLGLFDYLPDSVAIKLINVLVSMLHEGGEIVIGNYNIDSDFRFMMNYATDWELIYRSEKDMRKLVEHLPADQYSVDIERIGPEDANLFITLKHGAQSYQ